MSEIGIQLREARESQQLSLLEVERETRIRRSFLQAMEEERFSELPGDVYTRGFIRNYALFLKLNPQPLLDDFDRQRSAPRRHQAEVLDEPLLPQKSTNIGARVFLIVMALIALLMIGWYAYNRFYDGPSPRDLLRGWGISSSVTATRSGTTPTPALADTPVAEAKVDTAAPTDTPTLEASPTPTRTAFPTRTATAISGVLVMVDVLEDSWVYVVVDEDVVFDGTLLAGEQHTWQGQNVIALSIGNAGGIDMTVNNVALGVLGESGEVLELVYTPDTLPTAAP